MSLRAFRKAVVALAVGLGLTAGCSNTTAPSPPPIPPNVGTVSGIASPCWPYAFNKGKENASVRVTVTRSGQPVASQTVRGNHLYHFTLWVGDYVVSTFYSKARPITIAAGRTVKADLPDDCA
jgi:hypothetical protein